MPSLTAIALDGGWICESYIGGVPLNRIDDGARVREVVATLRHSLSVLAHETRDVEPLSGYVDRIAAESSALISANPLLDDHRRRSLDNAVRYLVGETSDTRRDSAIHTALSHGDFQPANILVDEKGEWLIDWEYAGQRQISYDAFVFGLGARASEGLASRLALFVATGELHTPLGDDARPEEWSSRSSRYLHATIFLLEELRLRLEENANERFIRLDRGIVMLERELDAWRARGGRAP